jgi:hypothetical protein
MLKYMRTTLSIDSDVATMLEQLRRKRGGHFKDLVNEALRRGLRDIADEPKPRRPFHTRSVHLGRVLIAGIDDVAGVLAIGEAGHFDYF